MRNVLLPASTVLFMAASPALCGETKETSHCSDAFSRPSIRKTFDGSKNEKEPASLNYVDSDTKGSFYLIDVGLKVKGCEKETDDVFWALSPSVEYHRSTEREKAVNKKSFALNWEYYRSPAERSVAPYFLAKAKGTRDSEAHTTTASLQALISGFSLQPGLPGSITRWGFRWYPYGGFEYLDQLAIKQGSDELAQEFSGSFAIFRLYAEWYPLRLTKYDRLQVLLTYTYRELLSGDNLEDTSPEHFTLGVNLFLNHDETIALSWQLEDGRGPSLGFLEERSTSVAFRVKIGD